MTKKLSPKAKRIRQKIFHRITRTVNSREEKFGTAKSSWADIKPIVHDAVTTALEEEIDEDSD